MTSNMASSSCHPRSTSINGFARAEAWTMQGTSTSVKGYRVSEDILAKDGIEFLVTRGAPPAVAALE